MSLVLERRWTRKGGAYLHARLVMFITCLIFSSRLPNVPWTYHLSVVLSRQLSLVVSCLILYQIFHCFISRMSSLFSSFIKYVVLSYHSSNVSQFSYDSSLVLSHTMNYRISRLPWFIKHLFAVLVSSSSLSLTAFIMHAVNEGLIVCAFNACLGKERDCWVIIFVQK